MVVFSSDCPAMRKRARSSSPDDFKGPNVRAINARVQDLHLEISEEFCAFLNLVKNRVLEYKGALTNLGTHNNPLLDPNNKNSHPWWKLSLTEKQDLIETSENPALFPPNYFRILGVTNGQNAKFIRILSRLGPKNNDEIVETFKKVSSAFDHNKSFWTSKVFEFGGTSQAFEGALLLLMKEAPDEKASNRSNSPFDRDSFIKGVLSDIKDVYRGCRNFRVADESFVDFGSPVANQPPVGVNNGASAIVNGGVAGRGSAAVERSNAAEPDADDGDNGANSLPLVTFPEFALLPEGCEKPHFKQPSEGDGQKADADYIWAPGAHFAQIKASRLKKIKVEGHNEEIDVGWVGINQLRALNALFTLYSPDYQKALNHFGKPACRIKIFEIGLDTPHGTPKYRFQIPGSRKKQHFCRFGFPSFWNSYKESRPRLFKKKPRCLFFYWHETSDDAQYWRHICVGTLKDLYLPGFRRSICPNLQPNPKWCDTDVCDCVCTSEFLRNDDNMRLSRRFIMTASHSSIKDVNKRRTAVLRKIETYRRDRSNRLKTEISHELELLGREASVIHREFHKRKNSGRLTECNCKDCKDQATITDLVKRDRTSFTNMIP